MEPANVASVNQNQNPEDLPVIQAILACRNEAQIAKMDRMSQNWRNREVFFARQDWSHKIKGQSREFLPKTANSVDQMSAFIKRGLVRSGDWFQVKLGRGLEGKIDGDHVRNILKAFTGDLWTGNNQDSNLALVISDAVKVGLLESLMILKVHGGMKTKRKVSMVNKRDGRTMETKDEKVWKLRIDLVKPEDYYPDPTGNGLYEIHWSERDLHDVVEMAQGDDPVYDWEEVKKLVDTDEEKPADESRQPEDANQNNTDGAVPAYRKRVHITEFWGTLLNPDGTVKMANCVCTIANDRFLIRKPEPNPFWHQESPFCVAPLLRVPMSVWHRALYDTASDLNLAINEMFNLILDGGLSAVWGVRQVRAEDLENPEEVSEGMPQGVTLKVKNTLPHGMKVAERVDTGQVPQDAMAVFEFLNREYTAAVLTNETKLGNLPPKQVRSAEIIEASQSQAITLDGIIADLEGFIAKVLRLSWYVILQNMDEIPLDELDDVTDRKVAALINNASPEERFSTFFGKTKFQVTGLSATMNKAMDFQKKVALMQLLMSNPVLLRAFILKFSGDKVLRSLMRDLNIDIEEVVKDQEELAKTAQEVQDVAGLGQMTGTGPKGGQSAAGAEGQGGTPASGAEGSSQAAEINQLMAPRSGVPPNA